MNQREYKMVAETPRSKGSPLKSIFRRRTGYSSRAVRVYESKTADVMSTDESQNDPNHDKVPTKNNMQPAQGEFDETRGKEISSHLKDSKIRFADDQLGALGLNGPLEPVKEGWLFKKNLSRTNMNKWSKRWFIISDDSVYYLRGGIGAADVKTTKKKVHKKKICSLMLSTVRECMTRGKKSGPKNPKLRFEIITSDGKIYMLQAIHGENDYRSWVQTLQDRIYKVLMDDNSVEETAFTHDDPDEVASKPVSKLRDIWTSVKKNELAPTPPINDNVSDCSFSDTSTQYTDKSGSVTTSLNLERKHKLLGSFEEEENDESLSYMMQRSLDNMNKSPTNNRVCGLNIIEKIMSQNPSCADCGKVGPDWVSLNLGVVLCIECSGVHRSLGVHISKVRSLRLDDISDSEGHLLLALGNKEVNAFRENRKRSDTSIRPIKAKSDSPRAVKEEWIRWKYNASRKKKKSDEIDKKRKNHTDDALFQAACDCNPASLAKELANGGNVHFRHGKEGRTALHACILSESKGKPIDMKLNLFWNDSQNEVDSNLEVTYTDVLKQITCAELLLKNGARISALDNNLENVFDCAVRYNVRKEIIDYLLKSSKKAQDGRLHLPITLQFVVKQQTVNKTKSKVISFG